MTGRKTEYEVEGPNKKGFFHIKRIETQGLNRTVLLHSEHATEAEARAEAQRLRAG